MGKRRKRLEPFELEIEALTAKGCGLGVAPDGRAVHVRAAPPGMRVRVVPFRRAKKKWHARRSTMVRPPSAWVDPRCAVFGLCGGCALQEISLQAQRKAKQDWALRSVADELGCSVEELRRDVVIHPVCGAPEGYGYRNKVEFTFGPRRFLSEEEHARGEPIEGRFLGFHTPGRFDRVVDVERCHLIDDDSNRLLDTLRTEILESSDCSLYEPRSHEGFWRHAVLRQGMSTGQHLIALFSSAEAHQEDVERVAQRLLATPLSKGHELVGVVWLVNEGLADVAQGRLCRTWGRAFFEERLGEVRFQLSYSSFFQTCTPGARLLVDVVGKALGVQAAPAPGSKLVDLYCGTGAIGLYHSPSFESILGVEEWQPAVLDAVRNAALNSVKNAHFRAGRVEQCIEELAPQLQQAAIVVDPPRAGLHPTVAKTLASLNAEQLVYVACKPGSLGRDLAILTAGRWVCTDLWVVDLFPQTGHVEMVARLARKPSP